MDTNKLEAALRRLEDEQFGRTLNFSGKDAAVVGEWMRWLRELKPENLRRGRTARARTDSRCSSRWRQARRDVGVIPGLRR
jgi:hypothetical protein